MAEPQTSSPAEQGRVQSNADKPVGKAVEAERRSFDNGAEAVRRPSQSASELARAGAETTRQMAATTRRTGHEIGQHLRSTFEPFAAAQMELNRWFDELWRGAMGFSTFSSLRTSRPFGMAMSPAPLFGLPAADLKEVGGNYVLALELPGLARQDIDLSVEGGLIVIRGHKAEEKQDATAAYHLSERRFGRFERTFPVPPDADASRIEAAYEDGVLRVTLPKSADSGHRRARIEIRG